MKKQIAILLLFLSTGCTSKNIAPSFTVGMPEKVWRDSIRILLNQGRLSYSSGSNDSTSFKYSFTLLDTVINAGISLNDDGIPKGSLRVIELDLTTSYGDVNVDTAAMNPNYPTLSQEKEITNSIGATTFWTLSGRISHYQGHLTSAKLCFKAFDMLSKLYGEPDSITDRDSHNRLDNARLRNSNSFTQKLNTYKYNSTEDLIDTSQLNYYFHTNNSLVIFTRGQILRSNYFIPFDYSKTCLIEQFITGYDKKLEAIKTTLKAKLTPADIVTIPLNYEETMVRNESGYDDDILTLSKDLSPNLRKTCIEDRDIKSLKGTIEIRDAYGSVIYNIKNIEIDAEGTLNAAGPIAGNSIRLDREFGHREPGVAFYPYRYTIGIRLLHKSIPEELRVAIKNRRQLNIQFVPNAILFTDGNVLK